MSPWRCVREADKANVYLEAERGTQTHGAAGDVSIFWTRIPDLIEIRFIETLPQEERENRFQVVLDNISDGVVAIGKNGSRDHH